MRSWFRGRWRVGSALFGLAALLVGCATRPAAPPGGLLVASFSDMPGWPDDRLAATLPALRAQCRRLALLPADTVLGGEGVAGEAAGRAGLWAPACHVARALEAGDDGAIRRFYETWFQPYRVDEPALVSGYYEPEVRGALTEGGIFRTPLLARPFDLVQSKPQPGAPAPVPGRLQDGRLVPYWTRAEIDDGHAAARPLLWLSGPADLFLLQVQGSGRIRLPDGSVVRVAYDGKNGRPYTPIGRVLVAQNQIAAEDVSMQSIRAWLSANPAQARAVMDRNEDYVFFRVTTDADADAGSGLGPPGALGIKLLPGRTAAVDRHAIPLGTPIFLDTTDPLTKAPWRRLVLAQDLGTDMAGPARADLFLGTGAEAEARAGRMHQPAVEYLLLPRPAR